MKKTTLITATVILALMSMVPVATAHDSIILNEIFNPAVNATDTKPVIAGEFAHLVFFSICKHDENVGYGGEQTKIKFLLTQINTD